MSEAVHVVAIFKAREGKEQELRSLLEGLLEPTWAEPGCVSYHLHSNSEEPGEFTFVEEWANAESFNAHLGAPHIQGALGALPDLLAGDFKIRQLSRIR